GVPLIIAGDGIPANTVRDAPASHVDVFPFVFDCVGEPMPAVDSLPGVSLTALAKGATPDRGVVSEYHATTSVAGGFMLRDGRYKYMHYVRYRPQLPVRDARPGRGRRARESAAGIAAGALRRPRSCAVAGRSGIHAGARCCAGHRLMKF